MLRQRLVERIDELKNALPSDISPAQFIRSVMTGVQTNPDILGCSFRSIWDSCMRACRDGLLPDGREGALVPYRDKCTWIPMYFGLLLRFQKSGQFKSVTANVVRTGDKFEHWIDENGEHLKHIPIADSAAAVTHCYAVATTLGSGSFIAVLDMPEITKIRRMSRATREDSPWRVWPEEMMKKTALRRLSKYLPTARGMVDEPELLPVEFGTAADLPAPGNVEPVEAQTPAQALDQFAATDKEPQP
jgi:recombination protein RecT